MKSNKTFGSILKNLNSSKIDLLPSIQLIKQAATVILMILFFSCNTQKTTPEDAIQTVKIAEAIETNQDVELSEIIDGDIEYIPLETNEKCLIGNNPRFYSNDSEIIVFTNQKISVFDRETGKYLREIGHYGRDPGGYQNTVYSYPYDEKNDLFYLDSWENQIYFRYNSSGKLVDKITAYSNTKEPDLQNSDFGEIITSIAPLNDTCFVGHVWNINGKQKTKLIIFNESNHRITTYPQYKTFDWDLNKNGLTILKWNCLFYKHDSRLNFFERNSDTIFCVSLENLIPRYVLEGSGFIQGISETNRFLLLRLQSGEGYYFGIFDKEKNNMVVNKTTNSIENDIDGFIPFQFYSANNNNEIIGSREAFEIKLWMEQNPKKAAKLPPNLQNLSNLKETDNPVVMIAKLRD